MTDVASTDLLGWTPAAVVFDCDGLLVDSESGWTVAETELFRRRGLSFGAPEKELLIGRTMEAACDALADHFGEPGRSAAIADELMLLVHQEVDSATRPMPGAVALVEHLVGRVPVAVASNSRRSLVDSALRSAGLDRLVPLSVSADDVARGKPAPDPYLLACERLGVRPADALAFEDSVTGLRSAQAAGMRTVGVPTLAHVELPADLVVSSLQDPRLLDWVRRW